MKRLALSFILAFTLIGTGCSDWIYRIDVPQGNYLDKNDIEDLRMGMTKEQVIFVLGRPIVADSFDNDTWYYIYDMKRGMTKRGSDFQQEFIIHFEDDKVAKVEGDFELPESFYDPIEQ
ncbi:outer membrane protein assembly factor BamE [Alteromonas sediminis]|uniref:Outer membrane protein assembly factor BamE n=1 Tax=Alteromonas sediminis TaxID=2259342 RepID=A0A3N5Y852_9ALTE|nr:outer membrane protein assembly factor BamE [Alteromonas sediminis]RPJ67119.1 outer membrane protein assembly factor BamE [Alteromonas sediminis]